MKSCANLLLKSAIVGKFGTQRRFAGKLGVDPSLVSLIVRGKRQLTPKKQDKWASTLGITPEELGLREYHKNRKEGSE